MGWNPDESVSSNLNRILENGLKPTILRRAIQLGVELFLGVKPPTPDVAGLHPALSSYAARLAKLISSHSHYFKLVSKWHREEVIQRQVDQGRLANVAIYIYALTASLARMDQILRSGAHGESYDRDRSAFEHAFDLLEIRILNLFAEMRRNADESMREAATAARYHSDTLPNADFVVHETSPVAAGEGRPVAREFVQQFPGGSAQVGGDGAHLDTPSSPGSDGHSKPTQTTKEG